MPDTAFARPLVLVIEDDPELRQFIADLLTEEGYDVVATDLGGEGLMLIDSICAGVVAICRETLINRFRERPPLGTVFVDERLRDYPVPLTQRSASKALRTIRAARDCRSIRAARCASFCGGKRARWEASRPDGSTSTSRRCSTTPTGATSSISRTPT